MNSEKTPNIPALSIRQPWAWLIVNGHKHIENRTWRTVRRGPILIHAGKTFDHDGYDWIRYTFPEITIPNLGDFECGGIVGEANIVNCVTFSISPWFCGPYGFVLTDRKSLPFQPCKGKLGFFIPK